MSEHPDNPVTTRLQAGQFRELIFGALSFVLIVTALTAFIQMIGVERLQQAVTDAGPLAPLAYILVKALTYIFAPLSAGPVQVSAGVLFGLLPGTLYTLIGETLGGSVSFLVARRFGRPLVLRLVGENGMARVDHFYERNLGGWQSLMWARLLLFSVWDFISYAAGFAPVKLRTYMLVSFFVGALPTMAFVFLGAYVVNEPSALLGMYALVAVLSILPFLLRKQVARLMNRSDTPQNQG